MVDNQDILKYWSNRAVEHQDNISATMPDTISFELELNELLKHLQDGQKILNIGCGNGIKDIEFCKHKKINLKGIDFSKEMIKVANKQLKKVDYLKGNLEFECMDILSLNLEKKYDVVITNRCLINLIDYKQQIEAINNIWNILKSDGTYLMMEDTKQGLQKINEVRKKFDLEQIEERWHNNYLDENKILKNIKSKFSSVEIINFNSTYYLISRTLNALLTEEGKEIDYTSDINKYAAELPYLGDYSPLKLFKMEK